MTDFTTNLVQYMDLARKLNGISGDIQIAANNLLECILQGGVIYVAGNGGSAADASHFTGELVGRFYKERRGLPCVSLTADMATITSIGNDYGYDHIFQRQLEALFIPHNDILITLSSSGNSQNLIEAVNYVAEMDGKSINLLGKDGGVLEAIGKEPGFESMHNIVVPSYDTPRIQEAHLFILHYFAEFIEEGWVNNHGLQQNSR